MKTYLRDNSSKVRGVINLMVDSNPHTEWKLKVLYPYIDSLTNLEIIKKYGWIDNTSDLKPHCEFIEKIITLCEAEGFESLPTQKFNTYLNQMISDWLDKGLDSLLYEEERKFYTRIAWQDEPLENEEKKDSPLQKKKMEALTSMKQFKNKLG